MSLRILRWDFHPILSGWVLNRMTIALFIQERQRDIWDRQKRRYRHRKGVMWRQRQKLSDVASSQGSWQPPEAERGRDRISPRASVGRAALLTPWCHTSGLYNCEIVNFYCVKPPSLLVSQQARDTYTACIKRFLGFSSLLHKARYFQTVKGLNIPPYIKDQGTRLPSLAVPKYFPHGHFPLQNVCSFLFISQCSQVMHQMLGSFNYLPASTMP